MSFALFVILSEAKYLNFKIQILRQRRLRRAELQIPLSVPKAWGFGLRMKELSELDYYLSV